VQATELKALILQALADENDHTYDEILGDLILPEGNHEAANTLANLLSMMSPPEGNWVPRYIVRRIFLNLLADTTDEAKTA
jgi:hypothetical protein